MDSKRSQIVSTLNKGMYLDSPPSLQPDGTYREAWGFVNATDRESGFGVANEASNELYTLIPEGYEVRGLAYAEERDWFVVFLHSKEENKSSIGIIDENTRTFRTVVHDDKLPDGQLCFNDELINIELKIEQPCNELYAYWSNGYTYRYLNLESDCCEYTLADMSLFRCLCGPVIDTYIQDGGGNLENGAYQFVAQLEDRDGNKTNWFKVSQPVYVADHNNTAGEITRRSVRLDLTDLDPEYEQVNIAVIKTIGGQTSAEVVFKRNYGASNISIVYTGQDGAGISLEEILTKNPAYIRGRNLAQKDGRLILYNILGEANLDYQQDANNIQVTYSVSHVPAEDAQYVKTVRRDENYMLGIRWNYCDGTSSADFIIPGREMEASDIELVPADDIENCSNCVKPRWALFNTSERTWTNPLFDDVGGAACSYYPSTNSSSIYKYDNTNKKLKSDPEQFIEDTEEVEIPQSFKDITDHNPNDLVDNICDCLTDLLQIGGYIEFEEKPYNNPEPDALYGFDLTLGIRKECCERLQQNISTFGGGFANGFNETFGSLIDYQPTDPGDDDDGGDYSDPGISCYDYECRDGFCPEGCSCVAQLCFPGSELTDGTESSLLDGYVPPSQTVTPNPPLFFHDIDMEDTDGIIHNIKDYLDAGKTVYIKSFTTWCSPCWDQHSGGGIDNFYNEFGPPGFDTSVVIAVEFDPSTTEDDLTGIGTKTQGDWTTAPYPIVMADETLIELLVANYGIGYFPQIIAIYPTGNSETVDLTNIENLTMESVAPDAAGSCSSCGGGTNLTGKCGGSGTCSEALTYDSCYECTDDGYCRFVCYKEPETTLQAIQNLLFHTVETYKRRHFYKYHGTNRSLGGGTGSRLKYAKVKIYSEDGCDVIDKRYPIVAEGRLGAWQSTEIYPTTKDCDGNYVFGDLAGKPVRLHRTPSSEEEPHFLSYHDGVLHAGDLTGYELQDTFVRPIWLNFKNIEFPKNPPKPLCPNNPFTISYVKRDQTNKRVIASGIFTHTFLGNAFGKDYVFPKHAVNSLEYVDRMIYNFTEGVTTECLTGDCLFAADCGPGCDCTGAKPDEIRFCEPLPNECQDQECDPAVGCGPDCDCVPIAGELSKLCGDFTCDEPFGSGCPEGCECDDPCQLGVCHSLFDCDGGCYCDTFNGPLPNVGFCTPLDPEALRCRPTHKCIPKQFCGKIPCTDDGECTPDCPVCPPPGGETGSCNPISVEKKGKYNDMPIYNFHSPDTSVDRPFIGSVGKAKFDLVVFGWGFRHGLYALGEEPDTIWKQEIDQRGTRQTVNLNHYECVLGHKYKCVSGITYAEADSVVDAEEGFTLTKSNGTEVPAPLMNLFRESSVYIQFEGNYVNPLPRLLRADLSDADNDQKADDASFIGDGHCHDCIVPRAGAWYGSIIHDQRDQYGSVEGLRFIPFGIEGTMNDALRGYITDSAGDAYIGPWTLVRKSYVSNKVGDDWNEPQSGDLKKFFCFGDCSKLPKSCNGNDPKNHANLRPNLRRCTYFKEALSRAGITNDAYLPRTLKTLVVTWVESDTNTWFRELGEANNFELAYPELKSKPLDSSLTQEPFDDCFLNQFAARHERIPQWKIYAKILMRIAAFIFPLLWFIQGGLAINETYIDIFIFVLRVVLFVALFILLGWVIFTCRNINRILSIEVCRTDSQGGAEREDVYGFRDNYARYNFDYSIPNDFDQGFSITSAYDTRQCLAEETNKVVYSDPQVVGSPVNAWRNFRINNYLELPMDAGPIQDIFVIGDRIYIQTTDNMWTVYSNPAQLQTQDGQTIYLGRGDFMNRADAIYGGVVEGALGTLDPNASVLTKYGHVSVDREARTVNIFNGQHQTLSDGGLKHFMRENMFLRLVEQFPDFKLVDRKTEFGVGFSIGIDNELRRILVTKIDYEAYNPEELTLTSDGRAFKYKGKLVHAGDPKHFCNKSFTASYSFESQSWVSFHYYTPNWYAWNRFRMYTFNELGMWEHNIVGSFQKFYGEFTEAVIEIVARDNQPFKYESTTLDTESNKWADVDYVTGTKETFDKLTAYNRHQSTARLDLTKQEDKSILENSEENINQIPIEYNLPRWNFSNITDRLISPQDLIFERDCELGPRRLNEQNISSDITTSTFVDNYLVYKLEFGTFDDIKFLVRAIITTKDTEET